VSESPAPPPPVRLTPLVAAIAVAKLALNVAFHGRYGYFRDELYYIACSDHLAWGYVDHPPLSIAILAATRHLFGDSLHALRFTAALAGALTVVLTGLMARRLGGGRFAQALAAIAVALSGVVLVNGARYYSMNAFDLLLWAAGAYVLLLTLMEGRERLWILYGAIAGLGLLNKYSMLFFGFGTVAGLVLSGRWRTFLRPWIWAGAAIAALLFLPHALWEWRHGFPSAEFIHNATAFKNAPVSVLEFFQAQVLMTGIAQTALWVIGLGFFALKRDATARALRPFAWVYPVTVLVMLAGHAKPYYLSPIYFPYLAAGACVLDAAALRPRAAWLKQAFATAMVALSLPIVPFAVPVLPVDTFVGYQKALGRTPKAEERSPLGDLPQGYADMFGWEEMTAQVAVIYRALPPGDRDHAVIFARNYGEAGAIDFFGPHFGLPHAISPHNNYWYWGTGVPDPRVFIVFGQDISMEANLEDLRSHFDEVTLGATTDCPHCMPYENHRPIFVCRGPRFRLEEIWPREKNFI
jgi:hypothetical protein